MGDTVVALPALRLLEQHGYRLELVGKGWAPALLEAEGWPVHVRPGTVMERVRQLRALRHRLRAADAGFDRRSNMLLLPYAFSAALDARLAGLRAEGVADEGRSWLLQRVHPLRNRQHALLEYWALACDFLGIEAPPPPSRIGMQVTAAKRAQALAMLADRSVAPGRYVLICPFANGKVEFLDRSWPAFPAFVQRLHAAGRQVVIVPGPSEVEGAQRLYPEAIRLDGVGLGVYSALLREAAVVVSNDTGPGHIAAGVGARLLSVWGTASAERWAPWGPTVTLMRRGPGEWPSVDEVLSAADQALP
ncbi:glycosyltransferase family 9 protein [Roseateles sp. BYS96W]|uniref:Glycosyltransferase family 9 protein n=1 Tax=Pelomonas nitida TaxID=3299027 RepID=A0ABW7G4A5_9BURK